MNLVNTETGEIVAVSPEERSAVARLTTAITALSEAVDFMPIDEVVSIKAQVVTIQTATKELDMSREAQELAAEAVRRAEWSLGRAIRKGQAEGSIRTKGERGPQQPYVLRGRPIEPVHGDSTNWSKPSPTDFASPEELSGNQAGLYALAEADPEEFDAALDAAKAEGNLSRANVVRKIKQATPDRSRSAKADVIEDLAARGFTSKQMADRIGVSDARVRDIAREYEIDIPADRMVGRQRRIDYTAAMNSTVTALENWASALPDIDFNEVDWSEADEWVSSLTDSLTELRRFIKQIKEKTHV